MLFTSVLNLAHTMNLVFILFEYIWHLYSRLSYSYSFVFYDFHFLSKNFFSRFGKKLFWFKSLNDIFSEGLFIH